MNAARATLLTVLLLPVAACLDFKVCNEVGCIDQASITVRKADGATTPMAVVMDADGRRVSCAAPPMRSGATICDDNRSRVEHRESNGRLEQLITFTGAPRRLAVTLMTDATVVAQRTFEPMYMEVRPNGKDCEPVCKQRSETWDLP